MRERTFAFVSRTGRFVFLAGGEEKEIVKKWKLSKLKLSKLKLPKLKLRYKLLLYLEAAVFTELSLIAATGERIFGIAGIFLYTLAAVTLAASCCYLVSDGLAVKKRIRSEVDRHAFVQRLVLDYRYRTMVLSVPGLFLNLVFAVLNGVIGIRSRSAWYVTLAVFYGFLSLMRFLAVRYERKHLDREETNQRMLGEIRIYRLCGILLICMTPAISGAVVLLMHAEGGKTYPGYGIFVVAMYTFYNGIMSVIHVVRARRTQSPFLMTIRSIGYVSACVSVLFLQTAMFASFGTGEEELERRMNGITGAAVCAMNLTAGVHSVVRAEKMRRSLEAEEKSQREA